MSRAHRRSDQAGAGQRLRQDRPRGAGPRPARGRRRARLDRRSTAALIAALGLPVTKVEDLTGFPECLDGRVKTLHPKVHAGILADRRLDRPRRSSSPSSASSRSTWSSSTSTRSRRPSPPAPTPDECVEQIDIGGPSMVRAAAKNHPSVAVVTSTRRATPTCSPPSRRGGFTLEQRQRLAAEAFAHTAAYDVAVASWMGSVLTDTADGTGFPAWIGATWERAAVLRYGENPHQRGGALRRHWRRPGSPQAEQLHGKEMSYNNYVDTDAARRAAYDFDEPARRDHQARQPVRHRGRRRRRRGAPQGARVRPGVGVRRRDRHQPAGHRGDGRAGRRGLHRGDRRARRTTTARSRCSRARRTSGSCGCRRRRPATAVEIRADLRRRCSADASTASTPPGDDPATWTLATGEAPPTTRRWPTSRSPGGPAAR